MKNAVKCLICLMAAILLPIAALAASDSVQVLFVDYGGEANNYLEDGSAAVNESNAFMHWIGNFVSAQFEGATLDTEDPDQAVWLDKTFDVSFEVQNLTESHRYEHFSAGSYPDINFYLGSLTEASSVKAIIIKKDTQERFEIAWTFEDAKMELPPPEVDGDLLISGRGQNNRYVIYTKEDADLTIRMKNGFSADSPVGTECYYEAIWYPDDYSKERTLLSSGAGAGVLTLKADEPGSILYTYGAVKAGDLWSPGYNDWLASTTYKLVIEPASAQNTNADYSETVLFTPGFDNLFYEISGFGFELWSKDIAVDWIKQVGGDYRENDLSNKIDVQWTFENVYDTETNGFGWNEYDEFQYPAVYYAEDRISEDSRIVCTLTSKADPAQKLVLERKFKDSGLVSVAPTIIGAKTVQKLNNHEYLVTVREGSTLQVKLNDYFKPDAAAGPRRYHWFELDGYQNEIDYWQVLNKGWGTGTQELVIKPEHDQMTLYCYFGASEGDDPNPSARGAFPGWGPNSGIFDSAALCYEIRIQLEDEHSPAAGGTVPKLPATGDKATPWLWLLGMVMAAGCMLLLGRQREHN
ncbi:MAG: LPXTG cell wall anchor domain-containing protein [Clostridia bacterium]|nr:LPXTG cell wall anchor domain-containing protein [Clostridia bacterium]